MRDMQSALRGAMADEVAGVQLPPDLAGQVRARHRRHRRIRLTATLASVAAIVVAVPLGGAAVLRDDQSAPPPADVPESRQVDGVQVTYLPDGLLRDPVDGFDYGVGSPTGSQWTAVTGRWRPPDEDAGTGYQQGVRVTVIRGGRPEMLPVLAQAAGISGEGERLPAEVDDRVMVRTPIAGRGGGAQWTDVFWHATDDVSLRVRMSDNLEDHLERIIDGLRVVGPGTPVAPIRPDETAAPQGGGLCAPETNRPVEYGFFPEDPQQWQRFGGISASRVPDQVAPGGWLGLATAVSGLSDGLESGVWWYQYHWGVPDSHGESLIIRVTCGDLVPAPNHSEGLVAFVADSYEGDPPQTEPYQLPDGRPAVVVDHHLGGGVWAGVRVAWVERPGVLIEVSVAEMIADELAEIIRGVRLE